MEKAITDLELVDLSKHNFRRTLDSLQDGAHSLLLLMVQWKEIDGFFDSAKTVLRERAKELQSLDESIKAKSLELDAKEKELCSMDESVKAKLSDLEKREKEFRLEQKTAMEKRSGEIEELERLTKRIESMEKFSDEKVKELELIRLEFEPLISLLAKSIGSSVTMPANCSNDLVKQHIALGRMIPYLDPGKLVLDAIERSFKEYLNKGFGEADVDKVVNSFIVLLEKLIHMAPKILPKVREEATQLGVEWLDKAKTNPDNRSWVLGCLLFLAAYDLAFVTTHEVLLNLLEPFLSYDQAPKLFRLLGLEDKVYGVAETLKKKEKYLETLRFVCEFRLYKLCPGRRPGALLHEYLDSSEKAARVIGGTGNSMEAQKARREKRKADAVMALKCIREMKAESMFPAKILNKLILMKNDESAQKATKPVDESYDKKRNMTNGVEKSIISCEQKSEGKRQRLTEPITPSQNSTVIRPGSQSVPSGVKIEESGVNHQADTTETKQPDTLSGSINADMLRELLEKQSLNESDVSNAIKCISDPAKLVLDTSMALCPKHDEGGHQFKLLITSSSCSLLLSHLKKFPTQIEHPVKNEAKKLAIYWKEKISKSKTTDELEVICFLEFLGIFGIVSEFKANDLLGLLENSYWQTVSPDLCQFLGLADAIPGFIQNLIKTGHRLKAINYIYSFGMEQRFHPVSDIIKDSLRITKESAEKSRREAKTGSAQQVAAIDRQIRSLRAAIRCIFSHKLESEFQLGNFEQEIKSLQKLKRNQSEGSKPDLTIKQSEMEKVRNVAETSASVTSNTLSKPSSVSKPKVRNRGRKRSQWGNKQRSVSIASKPSNDHEHEHGYGYSLNQRLTWPDDHYGRYYTGTQNSDYSYNQSTQSERDLMYRNHNPFYQHYL